MKLSTRIGILCSLSVGVGLLVSCQSDNPTPNIVLIMADDIRQPSK